MAVWSSWDKKSERETTINEMGIASLSKFRGAEGWDLDESGKWSESH